MKVTVVHPRELGANEVAAWRGFQQARPELANPFLAPEFTLAVGEVRPRARVAVLTEETGIVGFFPFELRALGRGVPIAAGLTDAQGLVHASGLECDLRDLLRRCGLAMWEFDHLVDEAGHFTSYVTLRAPSPVMDLSSGFDAYLAERRHASSVVKDIPRRRRHLTRDVGEVRFTYDSRDTAALSTVLRWKSVQYRRTGRTDRFAQPWVVELINRLHAQHTAPGFGGLLSLLHAGDELVAGHFGLRSDTVVPTWFPVYSTDFARYSPGLQMHLALAEGAAAAGIARVDMGRGAKAYKESLKSYDLQVAEGRVTRRTPTAALHWARRAPVRRLREVVTEHPSLFRVADRALTTSGRLRLALRRTTTTIPEEAR